MFHKYAGEVDDYAIQFTRRLSGETAVGYGWCVPSGLSAVQSASASAAILVRLSGGVPGSTYAVSGYVDTVSGRRLYDEFNLGVG